jgi:hypothetical protein
MASLEENVKLKVLVKTGNAQPANVADWCARTMAKVGRGNCGVQRIWAEAGFEDDLGLCSIIAERGGSRSHCCGGLQI